MTLDAELPEAERYDIAEADIAGLREALLDAEGSVKPAVVEAPGDDCVDVAMVAGDSGEARYLLAVATPDDGAFCPGLVTIAGATLEFLESALA